MHITPTNTLAISGEEAYELAQKVGPARPEDLRALAADLYGDESFVFGKVTAHRLRMLASQLEKDELGRDELQDKGALVALTEYASTLRDYASSGRTLDRGQMITLAAILDGANDLLTQGAELVLTHIEDAVRTREDAAAERTVLHRTIASLCEEVDDLESNPIVFLFRAGAPGPNDLSVEEGMDLALELIPILEQVRG